jgi:NADPH-dependent 2,4-dienoyl-CoA reductase/sulfur reductase-like enzyme
MTDSAGLVIVGGSVGGLRTAEALRRNAYAGPITLLEAGSELPYDRTVLSKKLLGVDGATAPVHLRTREDLDKARIEVRLRSRVESLDTRRRVLHLADGTVVEFSRLVVATGARARELPGLPRPAVHYLRTLDDAHRLRGGIDSVRSAVVVGAGFIGSEVAAAIAERGAAVTVVEPAGYPLGRVLGEVVGERLAALHTSRGVRLRPGRAVTGVRADRSGPVPYTVTLDDGSELPADLVVAGIGALPNTGWLAGSGIAVDDGVVCDQFCQSSVPGVFAVGDVARWPNELFGESMRIEHWTNAIEQAATVAWNITHPDRPRGYSPVPYVWSDQYGLRLQIVGRPRADDDVRLVEDDTAAPVLVALYAREGRMTGAFTLNATSRLLTLRRALAARAPLAQVLDEFTVPVPSGTGAVSAQQDSAYKML